jgi:hypothetical protein
LEISFRVFEEDPALFFFSFASSELNLARMDKPVCAIQRGSHASGMASISWLASR